jgi:hypothetical protein
VKRFRAFHRPHRHRPSPQAPVLTTKRAEPATKKTLITIGRWRRNVTTGEVAGTAVLATLIAALLTSVAMVSATTRIELGPHVGDILVFRRGAHMPTDWEFTVMTTAVPTATCSLRPTIMAAEGGGLVVEQHLQGPRTFQVHWAGIRTSTGGSDCGGSAELVVSKADLQLLSNLVGGPGVEPHRLSDF